MINDSKPQCGRSRASIDKQYKYTMFCWLRPNFHLFLKFWTDLMSTSTYKFLIHVVQHNPTLTKVCHGAHRIPKFLFYCKPTQFKTESTNRASRLSEYEPKSRSRLLLMPSTSHTFPFKLGFRIWVRAFVSVSVQSSCRWSLGQSEVSLPNWGEFSVFFGPTWVRTVF